MSDIDTAAKAISDALRPIKARERRENPERPIRAVGSTDITITKAAPRKNAADAPRDNKRAVDVTTSGSAIVIAMPPRQRTGSEARAAALLADAVALAPGVKIRVSWGRHVLAATDAADVTPRPRHSRPG